MRSLVLALKQIVLLTAVSFCFVVSAAETGEESSKFSSIEAQHAFVNELRRENIPFRVDQDGVVWYRINDQKKVAIITGKIINDVLVGSNAVSYANSEDADLFMKLLKQQKIPFTIKEESNRKYVTWKAEDNEQVKIIEQKVLDQMRSRYEK